MKSPSLRPCSATPWQKAAHCAGSAQTVGMVSDCAVSTPESEATKAEIAKADAPIHPRKCFMPPCRHEPAGRFGPRLNLIHAPAVDDWPMNGSLMTLTTLHQLVSVAALGRADGALSADRLFSNP